jgi:hypothetical protein
MPLAVCLDGEVIGLVPDGADSTSPEGIAALRGAAAAELGLPAERFEILGTCHLHPRASAVDCLHCEPLAGPGLQSAPMRAPVDLFRLSPAQFLALTYVAEGLPVNSMRRSTRQALVTRGLLLNGKITEAGLRAIGRN